LKPQRPERRQLTALVHRPRRLIEVVPELATELQRLLLQQGASALIDQVEELAMFERCRCGDGFCSSFYTAPPPIGPYGSGHRTIPLPSDIGILTVDVIGCRIVYVEVLRRDDIHDKIVAAFA
jgi:hypothetical protein